MATLRSRGVELITFAALIGACSGPSDPADRRSPTDPRDTTAHPADTTVVSIGFSAPASILVNAAVLLVPVAHSASGTVLSSGNVVFTSSDSSVAVVSPAGALRGVKRGVTTIVARTGQVEASATVSVKASVRVGAEYSSGSGSGSDVSILSGDTVQLRAWYVDANGVKLDELPPAQWTSANSSLAGVDQTGLVASSPNSTNTLLWRGNAVITAATPDGPASEAVGVFGENAGAPALLRLAHADLDAGPITFLRNHEPPVTLSYGQSVDLPIQSGTLLLTTSGFPAGVPVYAGWKSFSGIVHTGDKLALYVVGNASQAFLSPAWYSANNNVSNTSADSGLVRFVQGYNAGGVVYLRGVGEPKSGLPELCYFDPADVSPYMRRATGDFDVVVEQKYGTPTTAGDYARLRATTDARRAVTYVFAGDGPTMRILKFFDQ